MPIVKVEKTKNYTVMSNYHLQDKRLSYKAMGLLSQVLSLPNEWDYSIDGLVAYSGQGKKTVRGCLKELEELGYLRRERTQGEHGRFEYVYTFYERPLDLSPCTLKGHTLTGHTLEETQINTNEETTNKQNTNKRVEPPTLEDITAYITAKGYHVNPRHFYEYYEAGGWKTKDGKSILKNWRQYVVTWESREKKETRVPNFENRSGEGISKSYDELIKEIGL